MTSLPAYATITALGSTIVCAGLRAGTVRADGRAMTGWTSAALFGAVGDGTTDDTAALRAALSSAPRVFVPAGTYRVTSTLTLTAGQQLAGAGPDATTILKTDFPGAAVSATDADDVGVSDLAVVGPGRTVGSGNKGLVIAVSSQPIVKNGGVERVRFEGLDDTCVYVGSGYGTRLSHVTCRQYGYCGFFVQGGDGVHLECCTTIFGLVGFRIDSLTTLAGTACYAEQAGIGYQIAACRCVKMNACGNEAPINFGPEFDGTSFVVDGGHAVSLDACLSRQDTSGNPVACPHLVVKNGADQVRVTCMYKIDHATQPTPTSVVLAGAGDVQLVQCNLGVV